MIARLVTAFFLLFLALSSANAATPGPDTPEGILTFAEALSENGETYRAVTEFQRVLHHFGDDTAARRRALRGLGGAYAKAGRWNDAAAAYETLHREDPSADTRRALGDAWYKAGRNAEAARLLLAPDAGEPEKRLGTLAWLKTADPAAPPPEGASAPLVAAYRDLPQKSPALAGFLSALLPGAGHLYVDRPRDAATTALVNGLFLWGTIEAARRDEKALAATLGTFETLWYFGGVVGSVNAAHQWNDRARERWLGAEEARAAPAFSLWTDGRGGLGLILALAWR